MRYQIYVKPKAKRLKVESKNNRELLVAVTAPAVDGKANAAVVAALAAHFQIAKNKIFIIAGQKSRRKMVEIILEA